MPVSSLVDRYDQLILDLDGCVWVGDEPLPGAVEAISALREAGKRVAFVTNDPRHALEDHVRKLWRIGLKASLAVIVSAGAAMQHLLAETRRGRTAFVIGTEPFHRHVSDAGCRIMNGTDLASRADVVVVAGHDDLHFRELKVATQAVLRGAELIGLSRDRTFPMADGLWPGSGAILAAVEEAVGRRADRIVGKPEPVMMVQALKHIGVAPMQAVMVGDRLDTDILGGIRSGMTTALVLTGVETPATAAASAIRPDYVLRDLAELVERVWGVVATGRP